MNENLSTEARSFCRTCPGSCGVRLTVDSRGHLVSIRGDKDDPLTFGYACIKGLSGPQLHNTPQRLLHPQKRRPDGSLERISLEQALEEIASKLRQIIDSEGPRATAVYHGTQAVTNASIRPMIPAWAKSVGSLVFSPGTIDQSAKWVAAERLGAWAAGPLRFEQSDVWMCFGSNPLVSVMGAVNGFTALNPTKRLQQAKARGMKIIVIDPRFTETAKYADLFLQPYPGEDPSIAAGLLHIILAEGWEDRDFCTRYVDGLEALRRAVSPFTPEYVAQRAGLPVEQLRQAAELFAHQSRRGSAFTGTGPDMAARSNLAEHLVQTLNVICGRFPRAGEPVQNPGALSARQTFRAQVIPPRRSFASGPRSRVGSYGMLRGEMMSGILADEILHPGPGQMKALLVFGGNPASAIPDQRKIVRAFRSLELLVAVDPYMSSTAKLAHYILPPTLQYERPDLPMIQYEKIFFDQPFARYTPAFVTPPEGSELVDDWYVFWALARRLGRSLEYDGQALDMATPPTTDHLLAILARNAQVPLDEVKKYPGGKVFQRDLQVVEPASSDASGRFEVMPPDVLMDLGEIAAKRVEPGRLTSHGQVFTHWLIGRRIRETMNSLGTELSTIRQRKPYNPVFLHPDDVESIGLKPGDMVAIVSDHGRILAMVTEDVTLRPGVAAMNSGWGGLPDEGRAYEQGGASMNLLVSTDRDLEAINAMPRQTAIPINILKAGA